MAGLVCLYVGGGVGDGGEYSWDVNVAVVMVVAVAAAMIENVRV